jgi:nucleoside-diphosphate-sugar epimerase
MQRIGKPRILIVGCGDVGMRLLPLLVKKYRVFALTSSTSRMSALRQAGAIPIYGNLDQPETLWRLPHLAAQVIHLAPPATQGLQDRRTSNLLSILSHGAGFIRQLIYISTTGVYGDCQGALIDETKTLNPSTARAQRRVSAEQQIRAWGMSGVQTHILRVPGIYAGNRLPVERLGRGTPVLNADEDVYTNHVNADDLARLITYVLWRGKSQRVINACDDSQLKMADYFDLIAEKMDLPKPPRASRQDLSAQLDPMMLSFMSESRRIQNKRLKELKFKLRYPTVEDCLNSL